MRLRRSRFRVESANQFEAGNVIEGRVLPEYGNEVVRLGESLCG